MFHAREYLKVYIILFITVTTFKQGYCIDESIDINALNTILGTTNWKIDINMKHSLAKQKIFINGELVKFWDIYQFYSPPISNENAAQVASTMYLTLGCKCGETIIDILRTIMADLLEKNDANFPIESILKSVNETILKTVSLLHDFIEIAPNVSSLEPRILKVLFSLYITIHFDLKQNQMNHILNLEHKKLIIIQKINSIELYTILNCSSSATRIKQTSSKNINTSVDEYSLIEDFKQFLDQITFSDSNYKNYDIDFLCQISLKIKFFIGLQPGLLSEEEVIDIDSLFLHQKSVFDVIMKIVYQITATHLLELYSMIHLQNYSNIVNTSTTEINTNTSNIYFKNKELIPIYKEILKELKRLKFPTDFIIHISLILKILDEENQFMTTDFLNVIITKNEINLGILSNTEVFLEYLRNGIELHEFLLQILSIDFLVYYNRTFKFLHDFYEENRLLNNITNIFNNIRRSYDEAIFYELESPLKNCIVSLYAHCFKIQSYTGVDFLGNNHVKEYIRQMILEVFTILSLIISMENSKKDDKAFGLLLFAYDYLSFNIVSYPDRNN